MTRGQRLSKLGNAIREYRGRYYESTGKWIQRPKPTVRPKIEKWLKSLGLDVDESMKAIDGFKNFPEYHAWMAKAGKGSDLQAAGV